MMCVGIARDDIALIISFISLIVTIKIIGLIFVFSQRIPAKF